jgi:hypothetical protein
MKITIDYESSWRNSFLDGSNNEPLPKNGRKFVGSMTNLKKTGNFQQRNIAIDTVMGILNRLIGDQRKLYQSRQAENYYFQDIEPRINFDDSPLITNEMTYIRNITGNTDQNSFTGAINSNDKMFTSDYSKPFWGVLSLDINDLCQFIVNENYQLETDIGLDPLSIINRLELLNKEKPVENYGIISDAVNYLEKKFDGINYLNNKGFVVLVSLYCSALYLQLERLSVSYKMATAKTNAGGISGISKRGFTKKDFMNRFTTGDKKRIWGNPYIKEEFIKGEGKLKSLMTKASGTLEIIIDVDRDKAKEIKQLIENAGVSSFYLGKKGLGYVTDIDTRELRK